MAAVIGRRMKGVPMEETLALRRRVLLRERRRAARLPPRRPRLDAARQGPGRLPPPRPRAGAGLRVGSLRLHAAHVRQRRGRPGGDGRRRHLAGPVPAGRPLPPDHAGARRRRADRHSGELAPDGGRRRRRGGGDGPRAAPRAPSSSGRSISPGRESSRRSPRTRCTSRSRSPRTRPSAASPKGRAP